MDFLERMAGARTTDAAHAVLAAEARALDALHVSHRCGSDADHIHIRSSLPTEWSEYYRAEAFHD
ncbi:MAG: hypothetical protein AAFP78_16045, partial [Pseudomonadota bacterium]